MKVAHFSIDFSRQSETFVYDYVRGEEEAGLEVSVLTLNRVNSKERPFPNVHVVDRPSRWNPERLVRRLKTWLRNDPPRAAAWPPLRRRLKTRLRSIQPDIVHAHFGPAGVLSAPVAQSLGVPLIVTFYGNDASSLPRRAFWREAYNELWPTMTVCTVLSEEMKRTLADLGCPTRKLEVVHLSRELDQFPFRPPQEQVENVLFVGRLTPKKAPLDAIRAVEWANQQGASLSLDIVGNGPLRGDAERYVEQAGLERQITFHGRVPNAEVGRWMRRSDVFLLPSKTAPDGDREGTPTVLVEALASGLPCVSTRHAGIPEMIPEANHDFLCEEGDVPGLGTVLDQLSECSVEDLSSIARRGREKVERDFSLSSEVKKLIDLYESTLVTRRE